MVVNNTLQITAPGLSQLDVAFPRDEAAVNDADVMTIEYDILMTVP